MGGPGALIQASIISWVGSRIAAMAARARAKDAAVSSDGAVPISCWSAWATRLIMVLIELAPLLQGPQVLAAATIRLCRGVDHPGCGVPSGPCFEARWALTSVRIITTRVATINVAHSLKVSRPKVERHLLHFRQPSERTLFSMETLSRVKEFLYSVACLRVSVGISGAVLIHSKASRHR
jgi:hypothetical protein